MTSRTLLASGLACLALAVGLGVLIVQTVGDGPLPVDVWWNAFMTEARSDLTVSFARALDRLGGGRFALFVVPGAIAILLIVLRRWRALAFALATFIASVAVVQLLKNLFGRGRPEDMLVLSDFGSFPSGHAANAATIAVVLWVVFPRVWVAVAGAVWVLAMAFSRTVLSVHWLSDTIGGAVVGAGVAFVAAAISAPWIARDRAGEADDMIGFGIRPFRHEDRDAVAEVCVKTADAGTDATGMFRDDRLWADVFALPYVERHPDLAWVVEAPGAGVVGYVLGVADTDAFEAWFRDEWWPSRVGAYAESDAVIPSREAEILRYAGARAPGTLSATAEYPAHLHIDLLPAAQGQGLGRKLTDALFAALRERGVPGLHVGVDPRNTGAAAFYQRLGFERLPSAPGVLLLGIRLA